MGLPNAENVMRMEDVGDCTFLLCFFAITLHLVFLFSSNCLPPFLLSPQAYFQTFFFYCLILFLLICFSYYRHTPTGSDLGLFPFFVIFVFNLTNDALLVSNF